MSVDEQAPVHAAHSLSAEALGGQPVRIRGSHFIDAHGRVLQLRGFNVSGASKLPKSPNGLSHLSEGFWDHRTVEFVGRPFPIEEAPLHFARLQAWGHPLIRFLITWEALAHAGPGEEDLDLDYVEYLRKLFELMPKYGLKAFVCAHQDVWSRFSGGSGAPGWTFEAAGLNIKAFKATGAAYVHNLDGVDDSEDEATAANPATPAIKSGKHSKQKAEPSGPFVWPSGYQKLAAASMATLFWAGDVFAWKLRVRRPKANGQGEEEVSIQQFLQDAFLHAFGHLADELGSLEACVGFDVMNEPHRGLIGLHGWHAFKYETDLHIGHSPSLLQSLALATGHAQDVPFYVKSWPFPTRVSHTSHIDPNGKSAWLASSVGEEGTCVWAAHGAWAWDRERKKPVVLREDFFERDPRPGKGGEVEWYRDCWAPFVERFTERIRRKHPHLLVFVEPIPNEFIPPWPAAASLDALDESERNEVSAASREQKYATSTSIETKRPTDFVYAPHFYDLNVLFSKVHSSLSVNVQGASRGMFILKALYFGFDGLRKNYNHQLETLVSYAKLSLGEVPTIIGEVGVPFDINGAKALRDGNYSQQAQLYFALIEAMERNGLNYTLWNYNPDNTTAFGDGWNMEDFSVMCNDKAALDRANKEAEVSEDELYHGGRCLGAIIRPYAAKVAGIPLSSSWDQDTLTFTFKWRNKASTGEKPSTIQRTTEVYIPKFHFGNRDFRVKLTDGEWSYDEDLQSLYLIHDNLALDIAHVVEVTAVEAPKRKGSFLGRLSLADWIVVGVVLWTLAVALFVLDLVVASEMRNAAARRAGDEL